MRENLSKIILREGIGGELNMIGSLFFASMSERMTMTTLQDLARISDALLFVLLASLMSCLVGCLYATIRKVMIPTKPWRAYFQECLQVWPLIPLIALTWYLVWWPPLPKHENLYTPNAANERLDDSTLSGFGAFFSNFRCDATNVNSLGSDFGLRHYAFPSPHANYKPPDVNQHRWRVPGFCVGVGLLISGILIIGYGAKCFEELDLKLRGLTFFIIGGIIEFIGGFLMFIGPYLL